MSDRFHLPRPSEPESALTPGIAGVASIRTRTMRFIAAGGMADTSISGPVMLQQPPRWNYSFDHDGESKATLKSVIPIFIDSSPIAETPPPGSSDDHLATTEFVNRADQEAVEEAVLKARIGVTDGFPAAPGLIGEYRSIVEPPPGRELTTSVIMVATQIEIEPGDWDLTAMAGWTCSGLPMPSIEFIAAISTSPTAFPGWPNAGGTAAITATPGTTGNINLPVFARVLNPVPQTRFLLSYAIFPPPARVYAYGFIGIRRRR